MYIQLVSKHSIISVLWDDVTTIEITKLFWLVVWVNHN